MHETVCYVIWHIYVASNVCTHFVAVAVANRERIFQQGITWWTNFRCHIFEQFGDRWYQTSRDLHCILTTVAGNCNSNGRPFRTCLTALLHFRKCPCLAGLRWLHSQAASGLWTLTCQLSVLPDMEDTQEQLLFDREPMLNWMTSPRFSRRANLHETSVGSVELFQFVDDPKRPPGDFANAGVFGIPNRISPERDILLATSDLRCLVKLNQWLRTQHLFIVRCWQHISLKLYPIRFESFSI